MCGTKNGSWQVRSFGVEPVFNTGDALAYNAFLSLLRLSE